MNNFLICDLQFGSTGKGAIAYYLAKKHSLTTAVCAYTPNAGHTAVDGYRKFIHTVLPIAAAVPSVTDVLLGPGAVFDPQLLCVEAERIAVAIGGEKNLIIHPAAVPLINEDSGSELKFVVIGSTMKGTAAANWRRMQRLPGTIVGDDWRDFDYVAARLWRAGWRLDVDAHKYGVALTRGELGGGCIVEGAQGYSLSVYHGFYPHVTSRDTIEWGDVAKTANALRRALQGCGHNAHVPDPRGEPVRRGRETGRVVGAVLPGLHRA